MKTGILLSNLGTPSAPTFLAVRRYLKEFLLDPHVVDLARWKWLPILYGLVLTLRPWRSARNYRKIWTPQGSPLLVYTEQIAAALQKSLPDLPLALGMRYGRPSLQEALMDLQKAGVGNIIVLPLYPHYSRATTCSTEAALHALLPKTKAPILTFIQDYHAHPLYIKALAEHLQEYWQEHGKGQKLLLSYHGLPEDSIKKGDPYREQCLTTSRLLAAWPGFDKSLFVPTFQSRLGPTAWLKPYTIDTVTSLAGRGIDHIQVMCPGFACDCLETLEEIALQNRAAFFTAGGKRFDYIPCLNAKSRHIALLQSLILECQSQTE